MIKVEHIDVWGFEHAIRGMRNPLNSWDKSDSGFGCTQSINNNFSTLKLDFKKCSDCKMKGTVDCDQDPYFRIGDADINLMRKLYHAGSEHRKYLRQIVVSMDIVAPLYFYKELDTYKIGTVTDSCSTMHKIADKEFELDDFSHEHLFGDFEPVQHSEYDHGLYLKALSGGEIQLRSDTVLLLVIYMLNFYRKKYLETHDKEYWWQMIQLLPSPYNQRRTMTLNYENVINIIHQRTGHKLDEWNTLVNIFLDLPYVRDIIGGSIKKEQ